MCFSSMAANPKDRSLSSRKAAIGKEPWPNLPKEILGLLAWKPNLMHNITYPGAIKSWRSSPRRCSNRYPELLGIGFVDSDKYSRQTLPRFVNIYFQEKFPWDYGSFWSLSHITCTTGRHYVGYSNGVIVLTQGANLSEYYILDPAERCYSMFPPWDVNVPFRFIVSSALPFRGSRTCVLVLTGKSRPALVACRIGVEKYAWERHDSTIVDPHDPEQKLMKFTTAIAFEEKFYALSLQGTLAVIEDIDSQVVVTMISKSRAVPSVRARRFRECLLESNGDILLVFLIYQKSIYIVDQVEVFRLQLPKLTWIKVKTLGDRALFVEPECCLWLRASEIGCRNDCVYFTQGCVDGWWMYDLKSHNILPCRTNSDIAKKAPVWGELSAEH